MRSKNPFNRNRTEQMGEDAWKYFVRGPFNDLISEKPLIYEGSRGCGKTMFFLCNSWREKFSEYQHLNKDLLDLLKEKDFIGFYYKVDGKFVGKNLSGKGIDESVWQSIFNTYFNIIISKEVILFLLECIKIRIISEDNIRQIFSKINSKFKNENIFDLYSCLEEFDKILDSIEIFTNDPEEERPVGSHAGTLIKLIIEELRKIDKFRSSRFHIFIDEFEELNISQQIQINTLIKQSQFWLVYDIGVKTNGRYTDQTISGEIIMEPDDYYHHFPEIDSYSRKEDYEQLLVSICKKRFQEHISDISNEQFLDISFYLKDYGKGLELREFENNKKYASIKNRLIEMIESDIVFYKQIDDDRKKDVIEKLVDVTPDLVRMHICLLKRKDIDVKTIYLAAKENSKIYKDWKANTLAATYFLLSEELDIRKRYHGVRTFSMLSSGVIRSFLEICESAFDYAFSKGFSFDQPRSLTIDEQTDAAYYVSQSKLSKIEGYVPDGIYIKRFILALGKIFYNKHSDTNTTLGEPEPNHFYTKPLDLHKDAYRILDHAVMHNVLQLDKPTKEKNDTIEIKDYHLNHIYCPYFKISHRRERKIYLDPTDLRILILGSSKDVDRKIKELSNSIDNQQLNLF